MSGTNTNHPRLEQGPVASLASVSHAPAKGSWQKSFMEILGSMEIWKKTCESCTPRMFNIDPENRPRFPKKKPDRVPLPSFFRGGKCETSGEYQEKEQQKHPKDGVIDFF